MVRIISGECKGRRLKTLKGRGLRPTSDRAKETLFNILSPRIAGSRFLDLFSGTGNVGIEAASRGAEYVLLVESDSEALRILRENVRNCGLGDSLTVLGTGCQEALTWLASRHESFDLVFLDPPYRDQAAYSVIEEMVDKELVSRGGMVIAEHDRNAVLPEAPGGLVRIREKRVGDTVFSFYGAKIEG